MGRWIVSSKFIKQKELKEFIEAWWQRNFERFPHMEPSLPVMSSLKALARST